jgi:hypothetical protein
MTSVMASLRALGLVLVAALVVACYPTIAIEPALLPEGAVGQPYSVEFTFTGDDVHGAYVNESLPAGLTFKFEPSTDKATLAGTPTVAGTSTLTVHAYGPQFNFGGSEGERSYTLVVR